MIAKDGRLLARLAPLEKRDAPRELGFLAGQVVVGPEFDDPLPDEIQAAFEGKSP